MTRVLFFALLTLVACRQAPHAVTVVYAESAEDFPNPERGFYRPTNVFASHYEALSEDVLKSYRAPSKTPKMAYSVVSTLVYRDFVLDSFRDQPLNADFLHRVSADFNTARQAGVKLIPRFTYTLDTKKGSCPDGAICPPYGDASKTIVLAHIAQLKPVLQEHADVIAFVQMGFIGIWGENYYTDHFGDASNNNPQKKLTDANWADRIDVLKALLDALPPDIMVQVRTPQTKQRFIYGIHAPVTAAPLTYDEAFTQTDKARIGFHNDCFLASADDYGTYDDYGNSSTPHHSENTTLRKYFADDSRHVVVGGETCDDTFSPQNDCGPAGHAEQEMSAMHYTYLNMAYNNDVNNDWVSGGCMERIKKNLGYRLVLKTGVFPSEVSHTDSMHITLTLENVGYASPVNARPVELILRNTEDKTTHTLRFDVDLRKWYSGKITLAEKFAMSAIPAGAYELLLSLPDSHRALSGRPEYSIRLANQNTWEEKTGFNNLNGQVTVH
ncbi:DUF4832 domain-containing protein [Chryseolinea lacunae]|uniref:DUF4832 domain-containing protein n=1 Tax=Chryseolinea lacunae TaxID=2801331 RepID=A0ABS1L1F5_9BACT|nr:DUF4832 domain-containing protein [Chryseolinea lacunae]MBL0745546.1 DUF4832 domain-containing protein [Chryseolinea lacunae]